VSKSLPEVNKLDLIGLIDLAICRTGLTFDNDHD